MSEIKKIIQTINEFRQQRGWHQQTPPQYIKSIIIEAAELLEHIQWQETITDIEGVKEELADVLIYAFSLADSLNLDITTIIEQKLLKNAKKYPIKEKNE